MKIKLLLFFFSLFITDISLAKDSEWKPLINQKIKSESNVVKFDFQFIQIAQLLQLMYSEAFTNSYVIDPEVLKDERLVSFRYSSNHGDVRKFFVEFLDSLGFVITQKNSVDFVTLKKQALENQPVLFPFVYVPKHRDVSYLSRLLAPLFQGSFLSNRSVPANSTNLNKSNKPVPETSAAALMDVAGVDLLIFNGTQPEIEKLEKLLLKVDLPQNDVVVRGAVYEVQVSDKQGSAFSVVGSLLAGRFGLTVGSSQTSGDSISFRFGSLDAIMSALSSDNRFRVVSAPSLRVKSGASASFSVGQDVPVLTSITFASGTSQPSQSVEYRSSGVLFNISPLVHEKTIDLNVDQQLSNFAITNTGVNNSPTLTKRSIKTSVSVASGEFIILGGLTEFKNSDTKSGLSFLPKFMTSNSSEFSKTEIILLLQITKI